MEQEAIYVGIDVAKAQVDVAVRPTDDRWEVSHDQAGIRKLVSQLKALQPAMVLLEASGGLELPLVAALATKEVPVVVVNPRQVRDFARAMLLAGIARSAARSSAAARGNSLLAFPPALPRVRRTVDCAPTSSPPRRWGRLSPIESEESGGEISWSVRGARLRAPLTGPPLREAGCSVIPVYRDLRRLTNVNWGRVPT